MPAPLKKDLLRKDLLLLARLLLFGTSVLIALVICEVGSRYFVLNKEERARGVNALWKEYDDNYVEMVTMSGCSYDDTMTPHPYLGYVKNHLAHCGVDNSNNRGLREKKDIPDVRDPNYFNILVLGGSVADQIAFGPWIADDLNENYKSPNGKPFRVFNGGLGGWLMPNQNTMITLYGESFDGIISIDGYNEALASNWGEKIISPPFRTYRYLVRSAGTGLERRLIYFLQQLRRYALATPILKSSAFAYTGFRSGLGVLEKLDSNNHAGRETLERYFEFTPDVPLNKRDEWNRHEYETLIRMLKAQADVVHARYAHFLQPMPMIDKPLSDEEKHNPVFTGAEHYQAVPIPAIEKLNKEGLPVFSLTDVFHGIKETIYGDHIHCKFESDGRNSKGYEIMSKRITQDLARAWSLKKK